MTIQSSQTTALFEQGKQVFEEREQAAEAKQVVLRYIDLVNQGKLELIPEIVDIDHFVDINPFTGTGTGKPAFDALMAAYTGYVAAMPDLHMAADVVVGEGNTVLIKGGMSGTHLLADLMGVAPTGRKLAWKAFGMMKVENGKVTHHELVADVMSLMQQLELIPAR
jgi:predicted ester cyclase